MIQYHATIIDIDDAEHIASFIINKPTHGEKDDYRQTTSLNAFIEHQYNFLIKNKRWISVIRVKELIPSEDDLNKALGLIPIECSSVWDFYEKIGWDYKSKKFIDGKIDSYSAPFTSKEREDRGRQWANEYMEKIKE